MKSLITYSILICASFTLAAQSLSPEVVASAGESFSSSNLNLDWTLGEIMTESYAGSLVLTQGFHQPNERTTSIKDLAAEFGLIRVYPNPTTAILSIETERTGDLSLVLMDMRGAIVLRKNISTALSRLDLSHLPTGIYLLRMSDGEQVASSIRIKKL